MGYRLKRFVTALVYLSGAAAAFIAIVLAGDWWAWLLLGLLVLAAAYALEAWKYVVRAYRYPQLELKLAQHETRIGTLEASIEQLKEEADLRYEEGIEEGMTRVIGSQQSQWFPPPRLIALSQRSGSFNLVGEYKAGEKPIPIATRYEVQVEATEERRGVVEVVDVVQERRLVHLRCIERTVEEFLVGMEEKAVTDPTPPPGICLARMSYPAPRALTQAPTQR